MPFANKFRAMMDMPFPGDTLGDLTVESVEVGHTASGPGLYAYAVRMVLEGPGGQQGVRRALSGMLCTHCTTFSGYGNPYQLWFGKPEIESLGDRRYAVQVEGAGARVHLEDDLVRFLAYLDAEGYLGAEAGAADHADKAACVEAYLAGYRAEIKRQVDRYRRRLRRNA